MNSKNESRDDNGIVEPWLLIEPTKRHYFLRRIRSIWDVAFYCYYTLSARFIAWATAWMAFSTLSILFRRKIVEAYPLIDGNYPVVLAIYLAFPFVTWLIRRFEIYRQRAPEEKTSEPLFAQLKGISPSPEEQVSGFETLLGDRVPDGPILISEKFNRDCLCNPDWDMTLIKLPDRQTYWSIIYNLRGEATILSRYLWNRFFLTLLSKNPLVNEAKIGFLSPILLTQDRVEIYWTDYLTGVCTADLAVKDLIIKDVNSKSIKVLPARAPFNKKKAGALELLPITDTSQPSSLHGGVDIIAVSRDGYLRLAVQSKLARHSGEKRAPLGSGSMDWKDARHARRLKELVKTAAVRELVEEWGKEHRGMPALRVQRAEVVGYFRMPHRGGKPQFVVFAKLYNADMDLRADESEVEADVTPEGRFFVPTLHALRSETERALRGSDEYKDSVPLFGALKCIEFAIKNNPEMICRVAGYP